MTACEWAACTKSGHAHEDGYWHCREHLTEHRAQKHVETFGVRRPVGRPLAPCGTTSAYHRHIKRGEIPDEACARAHTDAAEAKRRARGTKPRNLTLDAIVIERALNGDKVQMNSAERREVVRTLARRGMRAGTIAKHIHASGSTVARLLREMRTAA